MFGNKKSYNKYDIYVFLLITSLVAGCLFGAFQLPRVFTFLFLIPNIDVLSAAFKKIRNVAVVLLLFILFSFVSSFWNPAGIGEGLVSSIYNLVHVLLFLEIVLFSGKAKDPFKAIISGFLVAFSISAIIASWELATDHHLSLSKKDEARVSNTGVEVFLRYFASVTFYNANTYVIFLCYLLPFLFYGFSNIRYGKITNFIYIVASVAAIVIALMNGSRGGALSIAIMIMVFIFFYLFQRKGSSFQRKRSSLYVLLFILAISFVLVKYGSVILNTLIMRATLDRAVEEESRFSVWLRVLIVAREYLFFGCGANGLGYAMMKNSPAEIIQVAHNIFLEILSEYGLYFLTMFLVFLLKIYKKAKSLTDNYRKMCLYQSLFAFPVIGIINSGYVTLPMFWAFLASIYVFAYYEQIRPINKNIRRAA